MSNPAGQSLTKTAAGLLAALLVAALPASAQTLVMQAGAAGDVRQAVYPEGALVFSVTEGDSVAAQAAFDPNEAVEVILQFESLPYGVVLADQPEAAKAGAAAAAEAALERERALLRADLAALDAAAKQGGPLAPSQTRLRFDYRTTFNGVALTTLRWAVPYLADRPYVRRLYADAPVRTLDEESNRIIRADRAHEDLGATGEGVVIAVIDTGIDYTHPDLGGGFGPGFKVAGGYDFFDDDPDPMDEHGHGTHVAGIAAADGSTLRGVAPQARLLAVRVIGPEGTGLTSTMIAGIDYAADPDGNPATADHADVINLSLGSNGSPADPASQAIDNAVRSGVVCVVAAGNQIHYRAIQSPGTAERAITVGATNNDDVIAFFSSRGPTELGFANKPDLVAPGVGITSTFPGGAYERFQGTSMSAPHVAGAAALLLGLHPGWDPDVVKAAMVQSAADLGQDVWTQGGGRLDVLAAAQQRAVVTPSTLSLGLLDLTQPVFSHTETLTLHNLTDEPQTFDLAVEGALPASVDAALSADRLTVPAGERAAVTFSVDIQTGQVPFAPLTPPPYVGRVVARSATDSLAVPFTFLKAPHLALDLDDGPPLLLLIHDGTRSTAYFTQDELLGAASVAVPLPAGTYDVVALFIPLDPTPPRFYVSFDVRERLDVTQTTKTLLTWKKGSNTLLYRLSDVEGNDLAPDFTFARLVIGPEDMTLGVGGTLKYDHVMIADVGARYALNLVFHTLSHASGADYVIPFALGPGITTSATLYNDPAAFKRADTRINAAPGTGEVMLVQGVYATARGALPVRTYFFSEALRRHHRLLPPFRRTVYYGPDAHAGSAYRFQSHMIFDAIPAEGFVYPSLDARLLYDSMILEITPGSLAGRRALGGETTLFTTTGAAVEETVGVAPPFWMATFANTLLRPSDPGPTILVERPPLAPLFANPGGDFQPGPVTVEVFAEDGTRIVESMRRNEPSAVPLTIRNLSDETVYETVFTFDGYAVQGLPGRATARLRFRLSQDEAIDTDPPVLTNFQPTANGSLTDVFLPGDDNRIRFTARDVNAKGDLGPVASAELSYRRFGDEAAWQPLPLTRNADAFSAAWPSGLPDGYYTLRVMARDANGFRLDYVADPALRVGGRTTENNAPPAPFALRAPEDGLLLDSLATRAAISFRWDASTDADGDALCYTLEISGPGLDTTLTAGAQTTFDFEDLARLQPGATYTWTARVSDGFAVVAADRPFSFRTEGTATPVETAPALPRDVALAQNYPNPFNPATTLAFALPEAGAVRLEVFDVLGRRVAVLVDSVLPAGRHTAMWQAREASSGVYLYRLTAGSAVRTRRMLLVR